MRLVNGLKTDFGEIQSIAAGLEKDAHLSIRERNSVGNKSILSL